MYSIDDRLKMHNWTPLHTRFISHRIGDGTVNYYGHYVWDNKNVEEFLELARYLGIKIWGPIKGDNYATKKITIHKRLFQKFAEIVEGDPIEILNNPVCLIENLQKLPKDHQIQTLLALIVDDGCCKSWMLILFEDQNKKVADKIYELWNSLFPNTATIRFYATKQGTLVHHIFVNRDGIIQLKEEINKAVVKNGRLADLWWKQKPFDDRYLKATTKYALKLHETKENRNLWKALILSYLEKNKKISFSKIKELLNLSKDRARTIINELIKENKIFITSAGGKSRYLLEKEDISFGFRKKLVLDYLSTNNTITSTQARILFNLGQGQAYKILKRLVNRSHIKQCKLSPNKTYYYL